MNCRIFLFHNQHLLLSTFQRTSGRQHVFDQEPGLTLTLAWGKQPKLCIAASKMCHTAARSAKEKTNAKIQVIQSKLPPFIAEAENSSAQQKCQKKTKYSIQLADALPQYGLLSFNHNITCVHNFTHEVCGEQEERAHYQVKQEQRFCW